MDKTETGSHAAPNTAVNDAKLRAWKADSLLLTLAGTVFLFISGLAILLAPFSKGTEGSVILHTIVGIVWLVPLAYYLVKHLKRRWKDRLSHLLLLGYGSGVIVAAVALTGVVLTIQAAFGTKISYGMDFVHTATGIAIGGVLLAHLLTAAARHLKHEGEVKQAVARSLVVPTILGLLISAAPFAVAPALTVTARRGHLPKDYSFRYGKNPFAPSLATTSNGHAVNPADLDGSASCGTAGCHERIHKEWAPSAHRYSAQSKFFQIVQGVMAKQNGAESTRYCAGCHDPISLLSGAKNIYAKDLSAPGASEGISCIVCHSITKTDLRGNANYVLTPPRRYLFETSKSGAGRFVSDFLIRAYPKEHLETFSRPLLKTGQFCAACHKQFIDKRINRVGWVKLQNQYDAWRKSKWVKMDPKHPGQIDIAKSLSCRECHMRLTKSSDPASGDSVDPDRSPNDGKVRNHRFIAANQWLPALQHLPGAKRQIKLTDEWLEGKTVIPETESRWKKGPVISLVIDAPKQAHPGQKLNVRVVVRNRKAGHVFPTGPLDIIQTWVELDVKTADGKLIYSSGGLNAKGLLKSNSMVFRAEPVDRAGNEVRGHNLWDMIGVRFKRSLFPGFTDQQEFTFICPGQRDGPKKLTPNSTQVTVPANATGKLIITARLRYRKYSQQFLDFVGQKKLTAPITDMSHASATIEVEPGKKAK